MISPFPTYNEEARQQLLRRLDLEGAVSDTRCQRYARLAARVFGTRMSAVTIVGPDTQWFRGCEGLPVRSTPRAVSFCGHAILRRETLQVADARLDLRFADNPLVTGEPNIRFYAGCPIVLPGDMAVGTLCLIDPEPRTLSEHELLVLRDLADCLESELSTLYAVADMDEIAREFFRELPGAPTIRT